MKLFLCCLCFLVGGLTGCATPAGVPDRSTSTLPERTLDRGFSSPGTAPTTPGQLGGPLGDSALPAPIGSAGLRGVR